MESFITNSKWEKILKEAVVTYVKDILYVLAQVIGRILNPLKPSDNYM